MLYRRIVSEIWRPDIIIVNKKICHKHFHSHRVKLNESGHLDKYIYLLREVVKLYTMKMTAVPIAGEASVTFSKALVKRLEELEAWKIIKPALLKLINILWRVLEYRINMLLVYL